MKIARAFSLVTFIRSLGNLLGPALGGLLANPAKLYPSLFSPDSIWSRSRYLLPNLVVASIQLSMAAGVLLFLGESHKVILPSRRDPGLLLRRGLGHFFRKRAASSHSFTYIALPENGTSSNGVTEGPRELEAQPAPISNPQTPQQAWGDLPDREQQHLQPMEETSTHGIFTSQMILQISSVSLLAFHKVSSDAVMGTFLSLPRSQPDSVDVGMTASRSIAIETNGGFGLSTHHIGLIFLTEAFFRAIIQPTCIPFVINRLGALRAYRLVLSIYPATYLFTPFLPGLPRILGVVVLVIDLWVKVALPSVGYVCSAVL